MPSICPKNWLKAKQLWIYAILLMSVGPVGPGGGIYSIIEDSLCEVYLLETGLEAKHDGYVPATFTHRRHLPIASIRYDA